MFRNESSSVIATKTVSGELEILTLLDAVLKTTRSDVTLTRSAVDYIARCSNIELLTGLAGCASVEARAAVAANHALPESLAWKLVDDPEFAVRAKLAENSHLAPFLLETLAEDEDERIAQRASRALDRQGTDKLSTRVIAWVFKTRPPLRIS